MSTAFQVMLQTARNLEALIEDTATSNGSTTTLIDSRLNGAGYADDDFNGGTFFHKTKAASGIVTDFVVSTGTLTFESIGLVAGDTNTGAVFGVMTNRYPRSLLIGKINEVLTEINDHLADSTNILVSTLTGGVEYTLADTVRVVRVWGGNASAPYDWRPLYNWRQKAGVLTFEHPPGVAVIKYQYLTALTAVTGDASTISDEYSVTWLALATAVKCARWRLFQPGAQEKTLTVFINDLMTREREARNKLRTFRDDVIRYTFQTWPDS